MKYLLFCFSFLLILSLNGQDLHGRLLDQRQGLLSKECYDINYDEKGYLIVSTQYGIMKYDGERFTPICTNVSIERRIIYDIEKSPDGAIYLLNSKNEIFQLINDNALFLGGQYVKRNKKEIDKFHKLHYSNDNLIILTATLPLKFSLKTGKISEINVNNNYSYIYDPATNFPYRWFDRWANIILPAQFPVYFPDLKEPLVVKENLIYESREDVIDKGDTTYLLINSRLYRKIGPKITKYDFRNILFFELFFDRLWLCTQDGLIETDLSGKLIHHHFKGEVIGGVVPLKNGGIAVSLNQNGVFISSNIHDRVFKNLKPTACAGNGQKTVIGNKSGEVFCYYKNQLTELKTLKPGNSFLNEHLFSIRHIKYENGSWYLNSRNQWFRYDKNLHPTSIIPYVPAFSMNDFFNTEKHAIMLGWSTYGMREWKNDRKIDLKQTTSALSMPNYRCGIKENDSVIIIAGNQGLFLMDLRNRKIKRHPVIKEQINISHIEAINQSEYLVSTKFNGIYHINKLKILAKYGTPCIAVIKAFIYKNQLIVVGNDGIYIKWIKSRSDIPWTKIFEGETSCVFLEQDRLFIGQNNDLIIKQLKTIQHLKKSTIILHQLRIGSKQKKVFPKEIPNNSSISLNFDFLEFDAYQFGLYYKLNGASQISQFIEGTVINFDALRSGNYQLQIYPVIDGKIQFNNSKTFHFTIEKTFWESTVFYILALVLAASLFFSIFLVINLRRKKRSAERSELESKMNEYKLLAVKAQVNPHFLSNGLAAIQALILKEDNELAAQYLAKFSYLMRKILLYSEQQFISISDELLLVDAYLELELLRFRHKFSVQKNIHLKNDELVNFIIPSLLLQPILENAIWHGLKDQEDNPALNILFEINEKNELVIEIGDNGHGFREKAPGKKHFSKGNQLIQERINTLNKQFETPVASLEILSSENGTIVRFVFSPKLYNVQA